MNRYLKILLCAVAALMLVSGSAFAGTLAVNHSTNTTFKVSLQALGTARNITLIPTSKDASSSTKVPFSHVLGQSLAASSFFNVNFTGAKFISGNSYSLCAQRIGGDGVTTTNAVASEKIGGFTGSGETSIAIATSTVSSANVNAGNFIAMVDGASCTPMGTTSSGNLTLSITNTTSAGAGNVAVNVTITSGGTSYDSGSATVATIINQFAYGTASGATSTIDYLSGAKNGSQFTSSSTAATNVANSVVISLTPVDYGVAEGSGSDAVNVSVNLTLTDSQTWSAVNRVYLMGNASSACNVSSNIAVNASLPSSGSVTLSVPKASLTQTSGTSGNQVYSLCADVTGNAAISQRTIKGTPDIVVSSKGVDISAGNEATLMTWNVNAFQAVLPYAVADSNFKSICIIDNVDTAAAATIYLDVASSTSGTTVSKTVGTVSAKTTRRVDLDTSVTPFTTGSGTDADSGTAQTLGLTSGERYAAKFTITSNPDNIHMSCFQVDGSSGTKRAVPVLKLHDMASGNAWIQ